MNVRRPHAQRLRKRSFRELRVAAALATTLLLLCVPLAAARAELLSGAASDGYRRTLDLGASSFEVQLHYGEKAPGSVAIAGEGSIRTALPGDGSLTLQIPHVVGSSAALGNAQLGASYDILRERALLPSLGLVAHVELPTAPGSREVCPRLRATAAKSIGSGIIESIRIESELWTDGPHRIPGYRAAVGTTLRLLASTSGSIELVSLRPPIASGAARESLAQIGVARTLGAGASVRAGIAARVAGETNSVSATIGIDRRF